MLAIGETKIGTRHMKMQKCSKTNHNNGSIRKSKRSEGHKCIVYLQCNYDLNLQIDRQLQCVLMHILQLNAAVNLAINGAPVV